MSERAKVSVYSDGADWYITETDGMATESTTAEVLLHEEVAALRQKADALAEALGRITAYAERQQCMHEDTHRVGVIWTICDGCGKKWADDEGGFQPYQEPVEITNAHAALAAYRNDPSLHDSERKEPSERMQRAYRVQGEGEGV